MKNLHITDRIIAAAVNIFRIATAITLIVSGFVKAVDPAGTQYKIEDYLEALGMGGIVPDMVETMAAVVMSGVEFTLGVLLLMAIRRRLVSRLIVAFMVVMTIITVWLYVADPVQDCGCFGDAITLSNGETLFKNVVLLVMAGVVAWRPLCMVRFLSRSTQWIVINYTAIFILVVSGYSLYYLPLMDFRPYKVGVDLREATMVKEGEYLPEIADFFIMDENLDDVTEEVLGYDGYTYMLISPFLEKADDSLFDEINSLYDFAIEDGHRFVCITASGDDAIDRWKDCTGARYPFLAADEVVLKTIIRSNPGVVLLHDGRIVGKWGKNSFDEVKTVESGKLKMESSDLVNTETSSLGYTERDKLSTVTMMIGWYLVPLLLLTIADRTWAWTKWIRRKQKENQIYKLLSRRKIMRKKIVAGNWKMNMNLQEGVALAKELSETLAADKPNCGVVICTPFIHLATVAGILDQNVIGLGAENCADKAKGAYTGEVSAEMVKSTGAQYVILGHSERREYYHETPEILKEKVLLALANGLKVIFCIGESLEQREANKQNEVVKAELEGSVFNLSAEEFENIVIAYEPIWAIGTGKTATAEQAEEIHAYIRSVIAGKYGEQVAQNTSILYGGSCKASNAPELFAKPDIDGGLIGGASLKAADFKGIIDAWK